MNNLTAIICLMLLGIVPSLNGQFSAINPNNVTIARDQWGSPHVFAKTDAEVAYGLAWANCEDAFDYIQETILATKGMLGRAKGKEGAGFDYFVHATSARDTVLAHLEVISPEYMRYIDGYCQGFNAYVEAHPKKIKVKAAFPATTTDILTAYLISGMALNGMATAFSEIKTREAKDRKFAVGSNGYAFNGDKVDGGGAMICGNPHFVLDGGFAFYESHLCSEEGLNIVGSGFHGGNVHAIGCNEHLAWTHTYNYFRGTDIYRLRMHASQKNTYEHDGQWLKLTVQKKALKVKVAGLVLSVPMKFYWSIHGPVIQGKGDKEWYAIRSPAHRVVGMGEQYYHMSKAQNWSQFHKALKRQQETLFNIVYADKDENIFYISNGLYPIRDCKWDSLEILPGERKEVLWNAIFPLDSFPQVLNPKSHYVFTTNHSPYLCTAEGDRPTHHLPNSFDQRPGNNNRSIRFNEVLAEQGKVPFSWELFKKIKYDVKVSKSAKIFTDSDNLRKLSPEKYPHLANALRNINRWNLEAGPDNLDAALFALTVDNVFKPKRWGDERFVLGMSVKDEEWVKGLEKAQRYLLNTHGSLEVPLRKAFVFHKLGKTYETRGYADVLRATYFKFENAKKYNLAFGDSYIFFAHFAKGKLQRLETLSPYAPSLGNPAYQSTLEAYNKDETHVQSFDKAEVLKQAKYVYHPTKEKK